MYFDSLQLSTSILYFIKTKYILINFHFIFKLHLLYQESLQNRMAELGKIIDKVTGIFKGNNQEQKDTQQIIEQCLNKIKVITEQFNFDLLWKHCQGVQAQIYVNEYKSTLDLQDENFKNSLQKNIQNDKQLFKKYLDQDHVNYGLGCIFGAFIGDALGSYLQFKPNISEVDCYQAMTMPGGGAFKLQPGQLTDDSQMASHLLKALSQSEYEQEPQGKSSAFVKQIALEYIDWYNSKPFDIGITTRAALTQLRACEDFYKKKPAVDYLVKAHEFITQKNQKSQSNGSLMRNTPMAFYISQKLLENKTMKFSNFSGLIRKQINMTHGNQTIFQSSQVWVQLLVELILRKNTKRSIKQIEKSLKTKFSSQDIKYNQINSWINHYENNDQDMDAVKSMGWAKIAFTMGMKQLKVLSEKKQEDLTCNDYVNIIKQVLSKKGDTDTNAAIVGGLIGSILGFKKLPIGYLIKQFELRKQQKKKIRSQVYEPRRQFLRAMNLIKKFKTAEQIISNNQIVEEEQRQFTLPKQKQKLKGKSQLLEIEKQNGSVYAVSQIIAPSTHA